MATSDKRRELNQVTENEPEEDGVTRFLNFSVRQVTGFLTVIRLKLKVIGFSNKRSGQYTRLGETVHQIILDGGDVATDPEVVQLMDEIKASASEIRDSEKTILETKAESEEDRRNYQAESSHEKPAPAAKPEPSKPSEPTEETESKTEPVTAIENDQPATEESKPSPPVRKKKKTTTAQSTEPADEKPVKAKKKSASKTSTVKPDKKEAS